MFKSTLLVAAAAALILTMSVAARAASCTPPPNGGEAYCYNQYHDLTVAIEAAEYLGRTIPGSGGLTMDEAQLLDKVAESQCKASLRKWDDAIQKLNDIIQKVEKLNGDGGKKDKLLENPDNLIIPAAEATISCLNYS